MAVNLTWLVLFLVECFQYKHQIAFDSRSHAWVACKVSSHHGLRTLHPQAYPRYHNLSQIAIADI